MNFRPSRKDQPELNLIPMIDVLIVLLIFLVLTTTFSREAQLNIRLPEAPGVGAQPDATNSTLQIVIDSQGRYRVNRQALPDSELATIKAALKIAAESNPDPLVSIDADRNTTHQSVILVLDALGQLGYRQVSFMTENSLGQ